jgi:hypothetical protein
MNDENELRLMEAGKELHANFRQKLTIVAVYYNSSSTEFRYFSSKLKGRLLAIQKY